MYVSVNVDVDAYEVLSELSEKQLQEELASRTKSQDCLPSVMLHKIYEEFRTRGDAPQILKDYLWDMIGRAL